MYFETNAYYYVGNNTVEKWHANHKGRYKAHILSGQNKLHLFKLLSTEKLKCKFGL